MKILIVGSGGREHCLAWKVSQSPLVDRIFCAPGNGGTGLVAQNIEIPATDIEGLLEFALREKIDLTVVGPEAPLVEGIVDRFQEEGLKIFGPEKELATLEGSKVFAKQIMKRYGVPTADFEIFDDPDKAKKYAKDKGLPVVVKAEGLAAGKGVIVAERLDEAIKAIDIIMVEKKFGSSGNRVVIEDYLEGEEASFLIFTDSRTILPLVASQDHKQIYDNDEGPNCYSEDTEILTKDGWKRFNMLNEKDQVATYNSESREILFERPFKIYWMKYKGPMIQFKNRNIDLLVTPNHRMLLQQRYRKKKIYVREANKCKTENYIFQSGIWNGQSQKYFILPEYDYKFNRKFKKLKINFVDWVRFMAVYLSEGYIASNRVYIAQMKKSKNFNKIKKIISKLPFHFTYDPKNHKFRINAIQLVTYLKKFGISHEKYVPDYIKNANREIILEFLKIFNLGDGDIHYGKMRFFSSSKRLIDDIQEMIIKLDCSGIITVDKRKTMLNPINKKIYKANPVYSIEMKKRNKTSIRKGYIKKINYNGYIGCVTVSTGFVIVRRNNRVAISGNTGGMGAYSPAPVVNDIVSEKIMVEIFKPLIEGLRKEGKIYKGMLYAGLMIANNQPYVLEFNVRFGDPEIQAILPKLKSDLVEVMLKTIEGRLEDIVLDWDERFCICVVLASGGYPGAYQKGKEIKGLDKLNNLKDIYVFHAGTKALTTHHSPLTNFVTNGGRVLNVVGLDSDFRKAQSKVYQAIDNIYFEGMHYRRDIGNKALNKFGFS
jgi:phosphoribosylamine-glycine ligase/CRISPR/Cas system-associated exonuclease Cas4 (RecB family)